MQYSVWKDLCPYHFGTTLAEFEYYLEKAVESNNLSSVKYVMSQYKMSPQSLSSYSSFRLQNKIENSSPEIRQYFKYDII